MCGIGGAIRMGRGPLTNPEAVIGAMNSLLEHRGPDGSGGWVHDSRRVAFDHRRLKIRDRTTGDQPMSDHAGNWITYNGEIYNYLELRRELGERRFRTSSDTE